MADNQLGDHVQGCLDEGKPASQERPVLVAGKDTLGNVRDLPVGPGGGILVEGSGGGVPNAVTVADCADVTQGCIADAAVTGDNPGTVSGKLRGLVKIITDVWDSINHRLSVAVGSQVTQTDLTVTGTLVNNNDTVTINLNGCGTAYLEVSNSPSTTLVLEATGNNTNWRAYAGTIVNPAGGVAMGSFVSQILNGAAPALYRFECAGLAGLRIRAAGNTAATACTWRAANGGSGVVTLDNTITQTTSTPADANGAPNTGPFLTTANGGIITFRTYPHHFSGSVPGWDRVYNPTIFVSAQATAAGNTILYTPNAGRKFRLMRYRIDITDDATLAVAGRLAVKLLDGATDLNQTLIAFVPAAALNTSGLLATTGWIDLGNGIPAAAVNDLLNINLSAALATGIVNVVACLAED